MPRIVNVTYHQEPEGRWVESIDAPGFFATGSSRSELRERVSAVLPQLLGLTIDEIELREAEISLGSALVPLKQPEEWASVSEGLILSWFDGVAVPEPGTA